MNRLHYFCTVVKTGSLVKASELLNISQPALSKAIKVLEGELNEKLIIPSGRGISITDNGQKIALQAAPLLEKINNLKSSHENQRQNKQLTVASFEVFSTHFLGRVISKSFPQHSVNVLELIPGAMEEAIINRDADIGITYLPIPHPDLDILEVNSIKMGVFGLKKVFNNFDSKELPFVIPNQFVEGTPSKVKGLDGWPDHVFPRNIKYKVTLMETALELCRQGSCVGYFPNFVINLHNKKIVRKYKLDQIQFTGIPKFNRQIVYMIKRKSDLEASNFKKISKAIRLIEN
ncbi:MAG: LysR family transcriptional regulator [Bdellovibrionaceae bacterium]|nr:LysR family transcriptional regulator [Pseudobdellovibrionaceae bacterium]